MPGIIVYPACAGIHLTRTERAEAAKSLPRMRGDPPFHLRIFYDPKTSTPHARGSTVLWLNRRSQKLVYPACAGIHLRTRRNLGGAGGLPRMRGDPPGVAPSMSQAPTSTPHARGSTVRSWIKRAHKEVYPACAGIHLHRGTGILPCPGLPRMRGDPPFNHQSRGQDLESTPHARGSTVYWATRDINKGVYPACAGIHPMSTEGEDVGQCLPRMRGDPPQAKGAGRRVAESTPHARGSTRGYDH